MVFSNASADTPIRSRAAAFARGMHLPRPRFSCHVRHGDKQLREKGVRVQTRRRPRPPDRTNDQQQGEFSLGLADWFSTFCSNIQVRDGGTISMRYRRITKRLNLDFWKTDSETTHSLYVGSYGRGTAIAGFSDLDMLFELPNATYHRYKAYAGNGPSSLLQAVKTSINGTYNPTEIGGDGQVAVINFTDNLKFEVLPGFLNSDNKSYTHPDSNSGGSWKNTNPRTEIEAIRTRNGECNGNLVQLCRMMRAWKNKWGVDVGGLLIDTLAYQFIESWGNRDKSYFYYDLMCRDFFKYASEQSEEQEYWKAPGSGAYVYGKGRFQYKAKRCYNISLEAIAYETSDPKKEYSAKQKWREIFGAAFPD